jgi:hypothetical protein
MTLCGLLAIVILLILIAVFLCGKYRREGLAVGAPTSPYCNSEPGKPFCNVDHSCVACLADSDCGGSLHCSNGVCVTCVTDANCGSGMYCRNNTCTPCTNDDDCKNSGAGKVCDTSNPDHHLCLQCGQDGDCPPLHKCIAGTCIGTCTQNSDCPSTMPTCIVQGGQGLCSACTQDNDCLTWTPDTPHCVRGLCIECTANSECPVNSSDPSQAHLKICAGSICVQCGGATPAEADQYCAANYPVTPYCAGVSTQGGPTQLCVQCRSDNHCSGVPGAPHCLNGQCVGCADDGNCPAGQHCGTGNKCVTCDSTHGCPSGLICDVEGQCVQCVQDTDCAGQAGGRTHCRPSDSTCVACIDSSQCGKDVYGQQQACGPDGACHQCTSDTDCQRGNIFSEYGMTHCSTGTTIMGPPGTCMRCETNTQCTAAGTPLCSDLTKATYAGAGYNYFSSPMPPTASPGAMQCAMCNTDADCAQSPAGPYCSWGGVCGPCTVRPDKNMTVLGCPSGQWCQENGSGKGGYCTPR